MVDLLFLVCVLFAPPAPIVFPDVVLQLGVLGIVLLFVMAVVFLPLERVPVVDDLVGVVVILVVLHMGIVGVGVIED